MSLGLLGRALSGKHCVTEIRGQVVLWVALCHWDCWARRRVGGAVPLGLVGSSGAGTRSREVLVRVVVVLVRVVAVLVRVAAGVVRVVAVLVRVVAVVWVRVLAG